jgi:hypothetical protein
MCSVSGNISNHGFKGKQIVLTWGRAITLSLFLFKGDFMYSIIEWFILFNVLMVTLVITLSLKGGLMRIVYVSFLAGILSGYAMDIVHASEFKPTDMIREAILRGDVEAFDKEVNKPDPSIYASNTAVDKEIEALLDKRGRKAPSKQYKMPENKGPADEELLFKKFSKPGREVLL